jgi:hypothetical protein
MEMGFDLHLQSLLLKSKALGFAFPPGYPPFVRTSLAVRILQCLSHLGVVAPEVSELNELVDKGKTPGTSCGLRNYGLGYRHGVQHIPHILRNSCEATKRLRQKTWHERQILSKTLLRRRGITSILPIKAQDLPT